MEGLGDMKIALRGGEEEEEEEDLRPSPCWPHD